MDRRDILKQYVNTDTKITIIFQFRIWNVIIKKLTFEKGVMISPEELKIGHMNFQKKDFKDRDKIFEQGKYYKLTGVATDYPRKDGTIGHKLTDIVVEDL